MRTKKIAGGKTTVVNLSSRRCQMTTLFLLKKGLSFCLKTRSHDKIKLTEGIFNYVPDTS